MIRRHFFLAAALGVLLLMVLAGGVRLAFFRQSADAASAQGPAGGGARQGGGAARGGGFAAAVTPAAVGVANFTDHLQVLGVAKGRQSVTLTSNTAELVTGVRFRDGQAVKKGQVLVDLQAREEDAAVVQAQAGLNLARTNYDRWKALDAKGFAPKATLDLYKAQYQQAVAVLASARSRRMDRAIRAPFSGVVGLSDVAPGALISPGTPIVSLDDLTTMRVDFDIPDRFLPGMNQGAPITATSDSYPNQVFSGVIAQFDTRVNEQTRAIRARAEFPNPGARLKPGMLVRVSIDKGVRQALAAPEAAVQFSADQSYVYLIVRQGGRLIAQQRPVVTGADQGGLIEIKDGLTAGDQIVADGLNRLQPNQAVRLAPAGAGRVAANQGAGGAGQAVR